MLFFNNYKVRVLTIFFIGLFMVFSISLVASYFMYNSYFQNYSKEADKFVSIYERTFKKIVEDLNYFKFIDFSKSDEEIIKQFQQLSSKVYMNNHLMNGVLLVKQVKKEQKEEEEKKLQKVYNEDIKIKSVTDILGDGIKVKNSSELISIIQYREPSNTLIDVRGINLSDELYRLEATHKMNVIDSVVLTHPLKVINNDSGFLNSSIIYYPLVKRDNTHYYEWYVVVPFTYQKLINDILLSYDMGNLHIKIFDKAYGSMKMVSNHEDNHKLVEVLNTSLNLGDRENKIVIGVDGIFTFKNFWQSLFGLLTGVIFIVFISYYIFYKEQKEVEIANLEFKLADAQKIASMGHLTWNISKNTCLCSDELANIFHLEENVMDFDSLQELILKQDKNIFKEFIKKVKNHESCSGEFSIRILVENNIKWLLIKYKAIYVQRHDSTEVFCVVQDITKFKKLENALKQKGEEFKKIAITDHLTKAFNRVYFDERFEDAMNQFKRYKKPYSIVLIDIDHFKSINDTFGHQEGDNVLVTLVKILKAHIRSTDLLARWGGEEFVILMPNINEDSAFIAANKLRAKIESTSFSSKYKITASFGVTQINETDNDKVVFKRVDDALYKAKDNGRNRVEVL